MKSNLFNKRNRIAAHTRKADVDGQSAAPLDAPVDEPITQTNPFKNWSKPALEDVLAALGKYSEDKSVLDAIKQIADELKRRPQDPVDPAKQASFISNEETADVLEGDLPEIAEAAAHEDDNTGITLPSTTSPSKFAAEMTPSKAVKLAEGLADKLKGLFLEAKPLTGVNESRQVRDAVDSIYHAYQGMGDAAVLFAKEEKRQNDEEAAQAAVAAKNKKSSLLGGLRLAAVEKSAGRASLKDRNTFVHLIAEHSPKAQSGELNAHSSDSIAQELLRLGATYARIQMFHTNGSPELENARTQEHRDAINSRFEEDSKRMTEKESQVETKIKALAEQLGMSALFEGDPRGATVKIVAPDGFSNSFGGAGIVVPTS